MGEGKLRQNLLRVPRRRHRILPSSLEKPSSAAGRREPLLLRGAQARGSSERALEHMGRPRLAGAPQKGNYGRPYRAPLVPAPSCSRKFQTGNYGRLLLSLATNPRPGDDMETYSASSLRSPTPSPSKRLFLFLSLVAFKNALPILHPLPTPPPEAALASPEVALPSLPWRYGHRRTQRTSPYRK